MAKSRNPRKNTADLDLALALELQAEAPPLGVTENAVFPDHRNKENYEPRTLVDQTLEIIDPTPNIYTLFMQFNVRFFSNKLLSVEVKWSSRMTSCAGVCSFHPRSRDCVISLSAPLLKLRPRKDLVETLLHEMIHGYLFLTNNNRDRDGHGPEFCKHMDRINREAGTRITIYHSFHDEVKLYQQHWWRCNGPCQQRHPYFGMVRRAMNRAPGPSDCWWKNHQQTCGGEFIKVREPEKKQKASSKKTGDEKKKPGDSAKGKGNKTLDPYFKTPQVNSKPVATPSIQRPVATTPKAAPAGLVKLGTATNKVHGWGTGGPGSSTGKSPTVAKANPTNSISKPNRTLSFSGAVGGVGTGRSNLLDKFATPTAATGGKSLKNPSSLIILDSPPAKKPKIAVSTPIILDSPPAKKPKIAVSTPIILDSPPAKKTKIDVSMNGSSETSPKSDDWEILRCPVCNIDTVDLNRHLDVCLTRSESGDVEPKITSPTAARSKKRENNSVIDITKSPKTPESSRGSRKFPASTPKNQTTLNGFVESPKQTTQNVPCPVCNESFEMDSLNEHLDRCLIEPESRGNAANKEKKVTNITAGPSSSSTSGNFVDLTDETTTTPRDSYYCLVCNARISGDIKLTDHLEECVKEMFHDSIDDDWNNSDKSSLPEATAEDSNFPCPICMKSIPEKSMNQHLDTCLSGEDWD